MLDRKEATIGVASFAIATMPLPPRPVIRYSNAEVRLPAIAETVDILFGGAHRGAALRRQGRRVAASSPSPGAISPSSPAMARRIFI
jgi:hypothetical protein